MEKQAKDQWASCHLAVLWNMEREWVCSIPGLSKVMDRSKDGTFLETIPQFPSHSFSGQTVTFNPALHKHAGLNEWEKKKAMSQNSCYKLLTLVTDI